MSPTEAPMPPTPSSTPCVMPREGSSGVEDTFQTSTRPLASSNRQTSVNVPPESTPTRHAILDLTSLQQRPSIPTSGFVQLLQCAKLETQQTRFPSALQHYARSKLGREQFRPERFCQIEHAS